MVRYGLMVCFVLFLLFMGLVWSLFVRVSRVGKGSKVRCDL